jgi:hypothetical protein
MAKNNIIKAADLFCGVGGTSAGLIEASWRWRRTPPITVRPGIFALRWIR